MNKSRRELRREREIAVESLRADETVCVCWRTPSPTQYTACARDDAGQRRRLTRTKSLFRSPLRLPPGAAALSSFIQRHAGSCGLLLGKWAGRRQADVHAGTHVHAAVSRTYLRTHAEAALKEQGTLGCVCRGGGGRGGGRSAKEENSPWPCCAKRRHRTFQRVKMRNVFLTYRCQKKKKKDSLKVCVSAHTCVLNSLALCKHVDKSNELKKKRKTSRCTSVINETRQRLLYCLPVSRNTSAGAQRRRFTCGRRLRGGLVNVCV